MKSKHRVLFCFSLSVFFSLLIIIPIPSLIVSAQTEEEVIKTIIKGVSYNESFLKNANFELAFEYYKQGERYDVDAIKAQVKKEAEKRGMSPQEIEKGLKELVEDYKKREENPYISGSLRNAGNAHFLIKDNQIRIDREYTQTVFKGPVDPYSNEEKYSENLIKQTYYYLPDDSYTIYREDKKLAINQGPQDLCISPLKFGLEWRWSKNDGTELFSDSLKTLLKEGKLKLAGEEKINGSTCYVLEVFTPEQSLISRWWIDPVKGYTVSRKVVSSIIKQNEVEREFIVMERNCTAKNLTGDVWIPETGVEKYYQSEDIKQPLGREERINITNCVLNTVTDKDVQVPDIDSGEYKRIMDMETGEVIDVTPLDTGVKNDVKSPEMEK